MKENLFSCSNTSKNVILSDWAFARIFHFYTSAELSARKWCKGKAFFLIYQIFWKLFSKNFQNLSLLLLRRRCRHFQARKWCKGKASFLIYQIFRQLFSKNFQEPYFCRFRVAFSSVLFLDCGCKVTAKK